MHRRPALSRDAISPAEKYQTSVPEWDRQVRLVHVHDEHREELGRLRQQNVRWKRLVARVPLVRPRYPPSSLDCPGGTLTVRARYTSKPSPRRTPT
jgi:hypothetical protein